MLEWLKRHAWKACIPLKGIMSSNLVLSAVCFIKFNQIRGCVGTTHPLFLFWGQRVVEPFPTGIQITDKIPAGSHGLFPRDFSFACRCGVVVMALVEVAGFSLLLPLPSCRTSFQSLALCPGGGRQCGGFPFYTFCTTASPPALSPSVQRFGRVRFNIFRSASRDFGVRLLQRPLRPVAAGLRS